MSTRALRVAIVGAGPAGFYAAEHLQKATDGEVGIDMFDRLPTPYGLVRVGVAPDHQKIKSVTKIYDKIAARPGFRYYGGVELGRDVTIDELRAHYDAVILSVGAPNDRAMGIPGEDLVGSMSATDFVAWYNGHPDYVDLPVDLSVGAAVVVGNGNVAVDVARILVTDPDELARTDIADHALEALRTSKVREVTMLGRRGPAQAAFTSKELRELGELAGVSLVVDADQVTAAAPHVGDDEDARRVYEALTQVAGRAPVAGERVLRIAFLVSPDEVMGDERVQAVRTVENELVPDERGVLRAVATDRTNTIPAGLILRAVGYKGAPIAGVPFDDWSAVVPNDAGRVLDAAKGAPLAGLYVSGWIKRGPQGVIGTNKADAGETVESLIADRDTGALPAPGDPDPATIDALIRGRCTPFSWEDWKQIDAAEVAAGGGERPRRKLCSVSEMRAVCAG